jgi:polysaccharide biosynthesis transport protein
MSPQNKDQTGTAYRGDGTAEDKTAQTLRKAVEVERLSEAGAGSRLYPEEDRASLKDNIAVMLKRKWTVISIFLVGLGLGAFYAFTAVPVYRSVAIIEVGEESKDSIKTLGEDLARGVMSKDGHETEAEIFKSRSLAETLVKRMNLDKSPKFVREQRSGPVGTAWSWATSLFQGSSRPDSGPLSEEKRRAGVVDALLKRMSVKQEGKTRLLKVGMEATDPAYAREMLANHIEIYFDRNLRQRQRAVKDAGAWLKTELEDVEQKLIKSLTALINFTSEHGMVSLDDNSNHVITFFNKAAERLVKSNEQLTQLEASTQTMGKGSLAILPSGVHPIDLSRLQEKLTLLESEYSEKVQVYSESYPRVQMLKKQIDLLREKIADLEKNLVTTAVDAAKQQELADQKNFERAKKEAMNVNSLGVDYAVLKKEVETTEQVYKILLQKSKEVALNSQLIGNNLTLIDPPETPRKPVKPRKAFIIIIGAFLGLTGGIAAAFFFDHMDDKVHTAEDVERELNLPSLGVVPDIGKLRMQMPAQGTRGVYEFLPYDSPRSMVSDAIGNITTSMMLLTSSPSTKSFMFTSAVPGEGKSLLSVSCAVALASEEKSVLVVDTDLRQPSLGAVFGEKENAPGLTTLVKKSDVKLGDVIRRSRVPGLYYLPAGPSPSNPVAFLRSYRMSRIADYLKKKFHIVIFDTPPLVGFPDVLIIKDFTDATILVTKKGLVPIGLLQHARKLVENAQGSILGVILNMADARASHYGRYRYSNHYKYYGYDKYYSSDRGTEKKRRTIGGKSST